MLEVNEFLVLDFIRDRATTTRPEIGRALGLSDSSVSRIVGRLLKSGLVVESPGQATTAGRPRRTIAFNHQAGAVLAVDLGGTGCHGVLADLSGATVWEDARPTQGEGGAFAALSATMSALQAAASTRGLHVDAVAVGIPAILDPDTGVAIGGPAVDWQEFEIVGRLRAMLKVPFIVENDANLAALAHAWRGDARGLRDFVTLVMDTGIGAAVVANGRLVKGRHNAAGEIGYLLTGREQLHAVRLGQALETGERPGGYGGLEKVAAGPSIASRARALIAGGAASSLAGRPVTLEVLFAAAAAGDALAWHVIDELLDHTALALAAITAIVDPEVIILDGSVGRSLQPYLAELSGRLAGRLLEVPRLCISGLGPNATVVGAIAAGLQLARERTAPSALFGAFTVSGGVERNA
ncbi:MAG: ROK family transcriptional regulator [Candidatus Limnocylindrales bacterium]|jgi:glucokinase